MSNILFFALYSMAMIFIAAGFGVEQLNLSSTLNKWVEPFLAGTGIALVGILGLYLNDVLKYGAVKIALKDFGIYGSLCVAAGGAVYGLMLVGWCYWQVYFLVMGYGG